jgi:hypothetical protein
MEPTNGMYTRSPFFVAQMLMDLEPYGSPLRHIGDELINNGGSFPPFGDAQDIVRFLAIDHTKRNMAIENACQQLKILSYTAF